MLKPWVQLSVVLLLGLLNVRIAPAIADPVTLEKDDLDTVDGLPWGANNWPYNTLVNIKEFGGGVVGQTVLDRQGEQKREYNYNIVTNAAQYQEPTSAVFITSWGSNTDVCFMEMVVQFAPPLELADQSLEAVGEYLLPTSLQIDIGTGEIVKLRADPKATRTVFKRPYKFHSGIKERDYSSYWYTARNGFVLNAEQATMLKNAKPGNAIVRVTFRHGNSYRFPIGAGTVKLWKDAYSFNPTCSVNGHRASKAGAESSLSPRPSPEPSANAFAPKPQPAPLSKPLPPSIDSPPRRPQQNDGVVRYPDNQEFMRVNRQIASTNLTKQVNLTGQERENRHAFQRRWTQANPPAARFLGTWSTGDRTFYVYPSLVRGRVCIVRQQGQTQDVHVGLVSNREVRFGDRGLFWINNEVILAARDTGNGALYPIFATKGGANLNSETQTVFARKRCEATLP